MIQISSKSDPINLIKEAQEYCVAQVKTFDPDLYLITLAAPKNTQGALIVLFAFNVEIERIPNTVSEETLGRIKLQWWREGLESVFNGKPRKHMVLIALKSILDEFPICHSTLEEIIDAREHALEKAQLKSFHQLYNHGKRTGGNLFKLTAGIIKCDAQIGLELGTSFALVQLMKSIKLDKLKGRCYLPSIQLNEIESAKAVNVYKTTLNEILKCLPRIPSDCSSFSKICYWIVSYDLKSLNQKQSIFYEDHERHLGWRKCLIAMRIFVLR